MSDFDEFMEQEFLAPGSGGGPGSGYVCQCELRPGLKVFANKAQATEHSLSLYGPNDASFFPFADTASYEAQMVHAVELSRKLGISDEKKPQRAIQLVLYGDTVVNKEKPEWAGGEGDRYFTTVSYSPDVTEALLGSLKELGLQPVWNEKFWAHVSFKQTPDPRARPQMNQNTGEMELPLVPFFLRVFKDENDAREYVGADPAAPDGLAPIYAKFAGSDIMTKEAIDAAFGEISKAVHDKRAIPAVYKQIFNADDLKLLTELAEKTAPF
jgi:hypothetical protein